MFIRSKDTIPVMQGTAGVKYNFMAHEYNVDGFEEALQEDPGDGPSRLPATMHVYKALHKNESTHQVLNNKEHMQSVLIIWCFICNARAGRALCVKVLREAPPLSLIVQIQAGFTDVADCASHRPIPTGETCPAQVVSKQKL